MQATHARAPADQATATAQWRRLRFADPELERQFLLSYRAAVRPWIRMSLIVALSTVLGFAIIDHWLLVGPRLARADLWRFGLQLPLVLIMMVFTAPRLYARAYQPAMQVAAPLFGVGAVLMAVEATPAQVPLVAARLLLVAFYYYFMIGLGFNAALRSNLLLIGVYVAAAVLGGISGTVATYSLFVLLCANLIGGAGCYALEHANRVAFLERRRLAEVAMHDGLTGLLNRAALEDQARSLWEHARRAGEPVSVMLIDIDHFKAYNDRYGHQAGDSCLREVAVTIRTVVRRRPLDLVARYGGEEIIAILVGGDRAEATAAAQSVLQSIANLRVAHDASPTRPHLTVSIGLSSVERGGEYSHERAVRLADIALYASKGRGRDCWSFHDGASTEGIVPAGAAGQPGHDTPETLLLKTAS